MQFYVIEIQNRADGVNNQSTTMRQKLSTGLQLFYERCAANVQTSSTRPQLSCSLTARGMCIRTSALSRPTLSRR